MLERRCSAGIATTLLIVGLGLAGCAPGAAPTAALTATPAAPSGPRTLLTAADLTDGFAYSSPLDESALTRPADAAAPQHVFEGRLELIGELSAPGFEDLGQTFEGIPARRYLPEFDYAFVQVDDYLVPAQRGLIITTHPEWDYIIEPGRVWQETGDGGYSRASFPFALVLKGGNAIFNGTMTFLFDDAQVSKVWYQITQETTSAGRANFWGLLDAKYHAGPVDHAEEIGAAFRQELADRFPTKPIEALAVDYPGVDLSAFGQGVTPEAMTWYGVVVGGVNYVGGCQTRFGRYPYCEYLRAASYSTAKSMFPGIALMRLAQQVTPDVIGARIIDYVPEAAAAAGEWDDVTFDDTLDMASGNFQSASYMADEDGEQMGRYFTTSAYADRIALAFGWPHSAVPGSTWVYHTSDTFIVTRAMQNYLQAQVDPQADLFAYVVEEVYKPLGMGPGAFSTMRTSDDNWHGQADGGYGLWWVPDDIAKMATLLNNDGGKIDGTQVLYPDLLAAAMQHNPDNRGVRIDTYRMYNDAFWAQEYGRTQGFTCDFWVPQMLGVSGNVVALLPNGVTYYYFSDNHEFTWDAAVRESNRFVPLCP